MHTLTNDSVDVELWDLAAVSAGHGPYLVTQKGAAPRDELSRESVFVLRQDGSWVDLNVYLSSDKPDTLREAV